MVQEKMSASPAEERECFERVWRRVMPEDRPDCPFRLYSDIDREGPPPAQESAPAAEREEDLAQEETDAPVGEGERLQAMIARALFAQRTYRALARRTRGGAAQTLGAMAAEEQCHARRLSAAYFILSGVRFTPQVPLELPGGGDLAGALRSRFLEERREEQACRAAAGATGEESLAELYRALGDAAGERVQRLRRLLEEQY